MIEGNERPPLFRDTTPDVPGDLSGVPEATLQEWQDALTRIGQSIQGQITAHNARVATEKAARWIPPGELAEMRSWRARAAVAMQSMLVQKNRVAAELRRRNIAAHESRPRANLYPLLHALGTALRDDRSCSAAVREAGGAIADLLDAHKPAA
jgi:hypothetical protein